MTLQLQDVVKRVGSETHIYPTTLSLQAEGFNILLGTTLAGKTTLMQLMAGLERPSSGRILFDGVDVTGVPVQKRNVSMVHQLFINYPNMTVFDNIASPLRVTRMKSAEIKRRVERVAELLRLTPMFDRRPSELSGGQQQRTALARALVKDASLVLLDEPLANLDFKLREELRDELPKLFAGRTCTVVHATTEPVEALLLGGQTATLFEGRVTQFGPTAKIYRQPADLTTAKVFSDPPMNTAPITKYGNHAKMGDSVTWELPSQFRALPDGLYTVGIRPHHVSPVTNGAATASLQGKVSITEISGSESVIHFEHGDLNWISQSHGVHAMRLGETASFHIAVPKCMYFDADGRRLAP